VELTHRHESLSDAAALPEMTGTASSFPPIPAFRLTAALGNCSINLVWSEPNFALHQYLYKADVLG